MANQAATAAALVPVGINHSNRLMVEVSVPNFGNGDTLTANLATLIPNFGLGGAWSVVNAHCEEYANAAAGQRTLNNIPVTVTSYNQATGVVVVTAGAASSLANQKLFLELTLSNLGLTD